MRHSGVRLTILSMVCIVGLGGASRAQNIFELIFGGGRPSAESQGIRASSHHASRRHAAHKRRDPSVADAGESSAAAETMKLNYAEAWGGASDGAGKCCASAADMIARVTRRDPTLREGDAFMTSDGLQVFVGDGEGDTKFVPVGQAPQLSRGLKERLQAMEKTPAEKPARAAPSRSRAEPGPVAKDRLIETENGRTIRLVGGFAN
jgi:hypothetical protein